MTRQNLVTNIDFATLRGIYRLPIEDAAKCLGVSVTVLKRNCRRHGVSRWPYRKIKSLDNMIAAIENNPSHLCMKTTAHLQKLKAKREAILSGKDIPKEISHKQKAKEQKPVETVKSCDWDWSPNSSSSNTSDLFQTTSFSFDTTGSSIKLPVLEQRPILPPISQLLNKPTVGCLF